MIWILEGQSTNNFPKKFEHSFFVRRKIEDTIVYKEYMSTYIEIQFLTE